MPLMLGLRPLKRWRYVALLSEELMVCVARVHVGPLSQTFWAVHRTGAEKLLQRTRMLPGSGRRVELSPGLVRIRDSGLELTAYLQEEAGVATVCRHGKGNVWTRKQAGVPASGWLRLNGGPQLNFQARAVIDDTAGHHARSTEWWWAAGAGEGPDGTPLAFNLVAGVNDPPLGSERAVWVECKPHEVAPVSFASDLSSVNAADGSQLRFQAIAERRRHENLLVVRSDYRAPFGVFEGTLPGGVSVRRALGVMEHHTARW